MAAFLNLFSLRVSRFEILSGCLEATSPSRVMFIPHSKPRHARGFLNSPVHRRTGRQAPALVSWSFAPADQPGADGKPRPVACPWRVGALGTKQNPVGVARLRRHEFLCGPSGW